jgi:hypothetical protein
VGVEVNLFESRMRNFSYNQEAEEFARQVLMHLKLLRVFQVHRIVCKNYTDMTIIRTSGMKQADDLSPLRFDLLKDTLVRRFHEIKNRTKFHSDVSVSDLCRL